MPNDFDELQQRRGRGRRPRSGECICRILVGQRLDARVEPTTVDVSLRQHGSQPCGQAAAAVEVAEVRLPFAIARSEAEKLCVERSRDLACTAGPIERVSGAIQHVAVTKDEVVPGLVHALGAGARQSKIFEMKRGAVTLEPGARFGERLPLEPAGPPLRVGPGASTHKCRLGLVSLRGV